MQNLEYTPTLILSIFALAQSLLLTAYSLISNPKNASIWLFSSLLLLLSFAVTHDVLLYSGGLVYFPFLFGLGPIATYLYGPLVFFLVVRLLGSGKRFKPGMLLHFLPFVVHFTYKVPQYFQELPEKLTLVQTMYAEDFIGGDIAQVELIINWATYYGHRLIYFLIALRLIYLFNPMKNINKADYLKQGLLKRVLLLSLSGYLIYFISSRLYLILMISDESQWVVLQLNLVLLSASLLVIAYLLFKQPRLFLEVLPSKKYQLEHIDRETSHQIFDLVLKELLDGERFTDADLSPEVLSKELGLRTQQIYEAIHQVKGQTIQDLVHHLRVQKAQSMLGGPDNELSVESIGLACGYNSRSTFTRQFKKVVGISPGQFMKSARQERRTN